MVDYLAMRAAMAESETSTVAALGPPPTGVEEFRHTLTTSSGWETTVKVFRPSTPASSGRGRPLVLLFHGGGFVVGSAEMLTRPGRDFAQAFGAVVVSAGYRLAPENFFPTGSKDAVDVAAWIGLNAAEEFGADLSEGFVVGGNSAGAQAAAVVASEAREGALPVKPTGLFLSIPALLVKEIVPEQYKEQYTSYTQSAGPTTPEMLQAARDLMQADVRSPLFSPFNHAQGLKGMPPTYVQVGNADPLRDDGVIVAKAIQDAGGEARIDRYDGLGHEGFTVWWSEEREPKSLIGNTMKGMGWLLGKEQSE